MEFNAEYVETVLGENDFGGLFSAIDDNPLCPGEVVLWAGGGTPVYSEEEALRVARDEQSSRDAEYSDE
jgi:hypothetical protein